MTIPEIKQDLLKRLASIEDKEQLLEIKRLLDSLVEEEGVYTLNEEEIKAIHEAEADYKVGNVKSHDEVVAEMKKWLGK